MVPKKNKITKKTKKKIKAKEKKVLIPIYKSVFSIILISLSVFMFIHTYVEQQEGVFGLLIEMLTLQWFGNIGYLILPLNLLIAGVLMIISTRSIWKQLLLNSLIYIACHQLVSLSNVNSISLQNEGFLGEQVRALLTLSFGNVGSIVIVITSILLCLSYILCVPIFNLFKPLMLILKPFSMVGVVVNRIVSTTIKEYKRINKKTSLQLWLVHKLFFRKAVVKKTLVKSKNAKQSKKSNQANETEALIQRTLNLPENQDAVVPGNDLFSLDMQNSAEIASVDPLLDNTVKDERVGQELEVSEDNVISPTINNQLIESLTDDKDDDVDLNVTSSNIFETKSKKSPDHVDHVRQSKQLENYQFPPIDLLEKTEKPKLSIKALTKQRVEKASLLEEALISFNVKAKVVNITPGPSVTRYELQPGDGVKISKITALNKDIALKLAASDVRIEAPIPGKSLVGIEVPNNDVQTITLRSIMEESLFENNPAKLLAGMGKTITGDSIIMNLAKMPHVLIAGATGSGKSVSINTIILSILLRATPAEVKFLMIDPKKVELSLYEGIPHLIAPVVTDPHRAAATLKKWALVEMEYRYDLFSKLGVKDIAGFNKYVEKTLKEDPETCLPDSDKPLEKIPFIVVIIDELADLMMVASQDVEQTICRLAQMARATGIHLVIATQRPSVNVVTGLIKANVPSRISFYLQSQIDSRTIIDMPGAEKLLGKGDMLYSPVGALNPTRAQGVFVSEEEVKGVVSWLKDQGKPDYLNEIINVEPLSDESNKKVEHDQDDLFEDAKQLIISTRYASTSYLQRKLRIGYNRAARIMDQLETAGVIAEYAGEKKAREVSSI